MNNTIKSKINIGIFFVLAFSITIFIFSIGTSATESQKKRQEAFNGENNKVVKFTETKGVTLSDIVRILQEENVSIILEKDNYELGIAIQSIIVGKDQEFFLDMKGGNQVYTNELLNDEHNGIFSNRLPNEKIILQSVETDGIEMEIENSMTMYDMQKKVIIPYDTFKQLYEGLDINETDTMIIVRGEEADILNALNTLEIRLQEIDINNKVTAVPSFFDERSIEGDALYGATFFVLLITIINSITISSLWVKERKKEIVLRKVFGAKDKDIAKIFFGELVIVAFIALFLSLGVQYVLTLITDGFIATVDIRLTKVNFINAVFLAIVTAGLITLPSFKFISKVQPTEMLREE